MTNHWTVCDGGKGCYLGVLTGISTVVKRWLDNAPTKWMVLWWGKSMRINELNGRFSSPCLITRGYKQQELGLNRLTIPFHNFSHILPLSISSIFQGSSLQLQPSSQGPGPTLGSARHMPAFSLAFRSAKWKLFLKGDPRKDMVDHGPKRDVNVGYSLVNIQKTMEKHQHFSWAYQRTKWPCSIAMLVYQRVLLLYKPNEYDRW